MSTNTALDYPDSSQNVAGKIPTTPDEARQQVQRVLAAAQHNERQPFRTRPPRQVSLGDAHLLVLIEQAAALDTSQIATLLQRAERVSDRTLYMVMLSRLAAHLPSVKRREVVDVLWSGIRKVNDPATAADILFRLFPLIEAIHNTPPASFMAVFDIARNIEDTEARTRSLIALSRYVSPDVALSIQRSVLETIDKMTPDIARTNTLISLTESLAPELYPQAVACALRIEAPVERARALTSLARVLPHHLLVKIQEDVLRTIEGIVGEEPRVEALIAFVPYLEFAQDQDEFPKVLERALAVAVNLPRRHFRARALVALAPHLPPDLQGEALAAVHSLPLERERATLLAQLARELPPKMLVASLAVAHTMQDQDARVHALAALARHVPVQAQRQTMLDTLNAVHSLPHPFEQVNALVNQLDILPDDLYHQTLRDALAATEQITNPHTKARALNMLIPYLPEEMLPKAVELAKTINNPQMHLSALVSLVERLPDEQRPKLLQTMLSIIRTIHYEYRQSRALMNIAGMLPPEMFAPALAIARDITDPYDRLSALIALAQNSPPSQRPALVGESWRLIKQVESGYDRASALAAIAPLLPNAAEADLSRAVGMAIGSIMDEYDQASAIILLAPLLASNNPHKTLLPEKTLVLREGLRTALQVADPIERSEQLAVGVEQWRQGIDRDDRKSHEALWRDVTVRVAALPLPDAVLCLGRLVPLVAWLGGREAAASMRQALARNAQTG
jgi:hypothetical protein